MNDRLADFRVPHPQLEEEPGRFRGGVKRFDLYKNEDSPALVIGGGGVFDKQRKEMHHFSSKVSPSLDSIVHPKEKLHSISMSLGPKDIRKSSSPVKYSLNDPVSNRLIEMMNHPAFKQPVFTRQNPKIVMHNPIVGYIEYGTRSPNYSLEKRSNLKDYGSRILAKDRLNSNF